LNTYLKKENKLPLIVGLTGGIGSGKSTISKVFLALNVPVFNSDVEAKIITNNDKEVVAKIIAEFGEVYNDGMIDSAKIASIIFNDKSALEKINNIIHPKVKERFDKWVIENRAFSFVIKESAIIFENQLQKNLDKVILVVAPEKIRVERVVERDGVIEGKVLERVKVQLSDSEKEKLSDYVIINNNESMVIPQVISIYDQIKKVSC